MKKSILFIAFICLFCQFNAHSQLINLLNEDFNAGFPAGWLSIDNDTSQPAAAVASITGDAFAMHVDYDTITGSDSILVATSWFTPADTASNYLILPALTMQANGNQFFFQYKSKDPAYAEMFEVLVSVSGTALNDFTDTLVVVEQASPDWTDLTLDLDAYAGQTIYLAVHHSSVDKFILCLDNFHVWADLQLSVNDFSAAHPIRLFPNPASSFITLQGDELNSVMIYDLQGKLVLTKSFSGSNQVQVDVESLNAGTYLVRCNGKNGVSTALFIHE